MFVNEQCVVYEYKCDLCYADYVGYTCRPASTKQGSDRITDRITEKKKVLKKKNPKQNQIVYKIIINCSVNIWTINIWLTFDFVNTFWLTFSRVTDTVNWSLSLDKLVFVADIFTVNTFVADLFRWPVFCCFQICLSVSWLGQNVKQSDWTSSKK